jgi:trehalose 6-phosphate synthase
MSWPGTTWTEGHKGAIVRAATVSPAEARRRMRAMRQRVCEHDVARWADDFLTALDAGIPYSQRSARW